MITGEVDAERQAVIRAKVKGSGGRAGSDDEVIAFIIDTGFDGYLSLPPDIIEKLQLPFLQERLFYLADNTTQRFLAHAAIILWDDQERGVLALASNGPPTIGMGLLHGFHLFVDCIDGGTVRIESREETF